MIGVLFCTFESKSVNPFVMLIGAVIAVVVAVLKPPLFNKSPTTFAAFEILIGFSGFGLEANS